MNLKNMAKTCAGNINRGSSIVSICISQRDSQQQSAKLA